MFLSSTGRRGVLGAVSVRAQLSPHGGFDAPALTVHCFRQRRGGGRPVPVCRWGGRSSGAASRRRCAGSASRSRLRSGRSGRRWRAGQVVLDAEGSVVGAQGPQESGDDGGLVADLPWSSAWVSRPKKVRSADRDTAAKDSEAKASGLMVRIRAMPQHPAFAVGWPAGCAAGARGRRVVHRASLSKAGHAGWLPPPRLCWRIVQGWAVDGQGVSASGAPTPGADCSSGPCWRLGAVGGTRNITSHVLRHGAVTPVIPQKDFRVRWGRSALYHRIPGYPRTGDSPYSGSHDQTAWPEEVSVKCAALDPDSTKR